MKAFERWLVNSEDPDASSSDDEEILIRQMLQIKQKLKREKDPTVREALRAEYEEVKERLRERSEQQEP